MESGNGYNSISKQFEVYHSTVKFIHKWKTFKTFANLPKNGRLENFTPGSDWNGKKPRNYSSDSTGLS